MLMTWNGEPMYQVKLSNRAAKDREKIIQAGLGKQVKALIAVLKSNPYQSPPSYEKLIGNLKGCYSRRINRQHRLVYTVHEDMKTVVILSLWTHYE